MSLTTIITMPSTVQAFSPLTTTRTTIPIWKSGRITKQRKPGLEQDRRTTERSQPLQAIQKTSTTTRTTKRRPFVSMDLEVPNTRETKLVHQWKLKTASSSSSSVSSTFPHLQQQHSPSQASPQASSSSQGPSTTTSPMTSTTLSPQEQQHEEQVQQQQQQQQQQQVHIPKEFLHGMPWKTSIDPNYSHGKNKNKNNNNDSLYYMRFWEHTVDFVTRHLTNVRVVPVVSCETGQDLSYRENIGNHYNHDPSSSSSLRMHTLQFTSDEFRLIRLTTMDAGTRTQVFTTVWYPHLKYNTPILGCDLLQFGQRKHLCIMDFQPIHDPTQQNTNTDNSSSSSSSSCDSSCEYEHLMKPIRQQYPSLHGQMSTRFYDHDQFFSSQMLLGRHDGVGVGVGKDDNDKNNNNNKGDTLSADAMVYDEFFPAFCRYMQTYWQLHQDTTPQHHQAAATLERHCAYDVYSAARDPAHGLLTKCFGQEFADDYVSNILFPLSKTRTTTTTTTTKTANSLSLLSSSSSSSLAP